MKEHTKSLSLLPVLITGIVLMMAGRLTAQTFTTLHSFTDGTLGGPYAGLILFGNTLYGTTRFGGSAGAGTVFSLSTDGTTFTTLYEFTPKSAYPDYTNIDGAQSAAALILSGTTLYGTAGGGGSSGSGTVFKLNTDGTGFATLHNFTSLDTNSANADGAFPSAPLILSGNTLYGTAISGGSLGAGTVFALNTDGTSFTTVYRFTPTSDSSARGTNSDGANPHSELVLLGNSLYGTTYRGGSGGRGTVFALNTNGTGFTTLHSLPPSSINSTLDLTNSDGANPLSGLILSDETLYGTAWGGGNGGSGTIFSLNIDGTGFVTLHNFTTTHGGLILDNMDGANPSTHLILSDKALYGTAPNGGSSGYGTVFAVNTDGTRFTTLHSFTALSPSWSGTNKDGAYPSAGLILSGNTLYGTTAAGGDYGHGTVFSITLSPPQLTILPSGQSVVLTWRTNATGFTLQSTTNLASPVWTTNSPAPVVVNGQYTVTNPISATQQFFRLSQ